jgi:hypothetical protein
VRIPSNGVRIVIEMTDGSVLAVNGIPCDGMQPGNAMKLIVVNGTEGSTTSS